MSDFEISKRKLRASSEFFIFFYNSFFSVASIIKGIKKSGCEHELEKKSHTADLYYIAFCIFSIQLFLMRFQALFTCNHCDCPALVRPRVQINCNITLLLVYNWPGVWLLVVGDIKVHRSHNYDCTSK